MQAPRYKKDTKFGLYQILGMQNTPSCGIFE